METNTEETKTRYKQALTKFYKVASVNKRTRKTFLLALEKEKLVDMIESYIFLVEQCLDTIDSLNEQITELLDEVPFDDETLPY